MNLAQKLTHEIGNFTALMAINWGVFISDLDTIIKIFTSLILLYVAFKRVLKNDSTKAEKEQIIKKLSEDLRELNKKKDVEK